MPSFNCPQCEKTFSSKNKLDSHQQVEHGGIVEKQPPLVARLKNAFTDPKKLATIFGAFLMVVLPLGTGIFFSGTGTPGPSTSSDTYTNKPPVGYNLQQLPDVDNSELPQSYLAETQLPDDVQVYLLYLGGPQTLGQGGYRPAVLLQYSCTDCPETVSQLTSIAEQFNQEGRWIYVAPYTDMDDKIAVSAFREVEYYDSANNSQIRDFACRTLLQRPLTCSADELFGNSSG